MATKHTYVMNISIVILLLFFLNSCGQKKNYHNSMAFINNSNKTVYVDFSYGYPDTLINFNLSYEAKPYCKVNSNSTGNPLEVRYAYETMLEDDTLMVYVFDAAVVESTPWDTIKAIYMVLKRYDLSLQDLEEMNWTVSHP